MYKIPVLIWINGMLFLIFSKLWNAIIYREFLYSVYVNFLVIVGIGLFVNYFLIDIKYYMIFEIVFSFIAFRSSFFNRFVDLLMKRINAVLLFSYVPGLNLVGFVHYWARLFPKEIFLQLNAEDAEDPMMLFQFLSLKNNFILVHLFKFFLVFVMFQTILILLWSINKGKIKKILIVIWFICLLVSIDYEFFVEIESQFWKSLMIFVSSIPYLISTSQMIYWILEKFNYIQ